MRIVQLQWVVWLKGDNITEEIKIKKKYNIKEHDIYKIVSVRMKEDMIGQLDELSV